MTTTPGRGVLDLPAALVHGTDSPAGGQATSIERRPAGGARCIVGVVGHEREWDDVSCESVEQICLLHVPDPCSLALPDEVEDCSKRR